MVMYIMSYSSSARRSVIDYGETVAPVLTAGPTLHDVMAALTSMQNKFVALENSLQFMSNSIDELNNQVRLLSNENSVLKSKLIDMERDNEDYADKFNWMEANADKKNQLNIATNIIMCGIPMDIANTQEVFIAITAKLGENISTDDIKSIEKMKHKNEVNNAFKHAYIISLKTIELKNNILNNFRKKKTLFLDEIDVKYGKSRIILLHQFTSFQSKLYNETKKFKTKYNYRFLWCVNNKILLRKQTDSNAHYIRTFSDLTRLQKCLSTAELSAHPVDQ